jgi:hypothetical protein
MRALCPCVCCVRPRMLRPCGRAACRAAARSCVSCGALRASERPSARAWERGCFPAPVWSCVSRVSLRSCVSLGRARHARHACRSVVRVGRACRACRAVVRVVRCAARVRASVRACLGAWVRPRARVVLRIVGVVRVARPCVSRGRARRAAGARRACRRSCVSSVVRVARSCASRPSMFARRACRSLGRYNDWRSAAWPRRSAATEGHVSCNVRVGRRTPGSEHHFTRHVTRAGLVSLPGTRVYSPIMPMG